MQAMFDRYSTGLLISAVAIQNAQPPDQVQAAFDDASKAVQDKERQINEGQAYANDVVPRARGNAARLIQESEGYRVKVVETAQGDASRFRQVLTEYAKAPAVMRERMYLDAIQQIFQQYHQTAGRYAQQFTIAVPAARSPAATRRGRKRATCAGRRDAGPGGQHGFDGRDRSQPGHIA